MPEQELKPQDEQLSPGMQELGTSMSLDELTREGISKIKPVIIFPPMLIAAVMAFLLAFVNGATVERIEENKKNDLRQKLEVVVLGATENDPRKFANDPMAENDGKGEELLTGRNTVNRYTGELPEGGVGYGITSKVNTGYGGGFSVVFGVTPDGEVTQARILESAETPGLGSKAAAPEWLKQFEGKSLDNFIFGVSKDTVSNRDGEPPAAGQVDAITGATITSRAVCDAVRQGLNVVEQNPAGEYVPAAGADSEPAPEDESIPEPTASDGGESDGE